MLFSATLDGPVGDIATSYTNDASRFTATAPPAREQGTIEHTFVPVTVDSKFDRLIAQLNESGIWPAPVVTQVVPLTEFFPAEKYHQEYFARNPGQGYCQIVVAPKVAKFRQQHLAKLPETERGPWRQLWAESLGKKDLGSTPVANGSRLPV